MHDVLPGCWPLAVRIPPTDCRWNDSTAKGGSSTACIDRMQISRAGVNIMIISSCCLQWQGDHVKGWSALPTVPTKTHLGGNGSLHRGRGLQVLVRAVLQGVWGEDGSAAAGHSSHNRQLRSGSWWCAVAGCMNPGLAAKQRLRVRIWSARLLDTATLGS